MHKSITANRWDNPRLAKQAVAKNVRKYANQVMKFNSDFALSCQWLFIYK